jgi:hypothetical protein
MLHLRFRVNSPTVAIAAANIKHFARELYAHIIAMMNSIYESQMERSQMRLAPIKSFSHRLDSPRAG